MIDADLAAQAVQEAKLRLRTSPVFKRIVDLTLDDPSMANLLGHSTDISQAVQLYPASIHALLMASTDTPLSRYFPSLGGTAEPSGAAFGAEMRRFVLRHRDEIELLLRNFPYIVKSDIRRAAILRCGVAEAWRAVGSPESYALIDFGCGIGTALLLDRCETKVEERRLNLRIDPLQVLEIPLRSGAAPNPALAPASRRFGLDITRLDPTSADDRNFVLGHVFPEQVGAFQGLAAAIRKLSLDPPEYRIGDTLLELQQILGELPPGLPVILMHSMMIHCLPQSARDGLDRILQDEAGRRPLARVSFEIAGPASSLRLAVNGQPPHMLGRAGYDADWLSWMA